MLSALDKLGVVGTRVVNETKDDLIAELRHLEPLLRKLSDTGQDLVPGLVAAASYPFPIDAAAAIHGDFANVIFKMQIKLTPVSEGGLLPTSLQDVISLCRATPTAPICTPGGDAVAQLCSVIGSLPLCKSTNSASISAALDRANKGLAPAGTSSVPTDPTPSDPLGAADGGSDGALVQLIGGLLGGGPR